MIELIGDNFQKRKKIKEANLKIFLSKLEANYHSSQPFITFDSV